MKDSKHKRKSLSLKDDKMHLLNEDEQRPSIVQIKIENSIQVITKNNTKVVINSIPEGLKFINDRNVECVERKDGYGNRIVKGKGKKQRVSFKDLLLKELLVEIVNVDKEIYCEENSKSKENDNVSCMCLIY